MPQSTNVSLPREHTARYPPRCVRCHADTQGKTILLWTHTIGWWTLFLWIFGSRFSTRAPACFGCALRIRLQRLGRIAITIVVAVAFLFFLWPYIENSIAEPIQKWVAMTLILLCLAPYLLWEVFFPPPIDITAHQSEVVYEFRDADYAYEFASLNRDAEWMEIK